MVWPSDALKRGGDSAIKITAGDGRRGVAIRGASSLTVARVIARARVSRRLLYEQFADIEDCSGRASMGGGPARTAVVEEP